MTARSLFSRLALLALATVTAVTAWALGTGRVTAEVTHGVSMQPLYHTGDLVIVARSGSYHPGEIVAYRGDLDGNSVILHRIIGGDGTAGFVMKGDNNQSIDPTHPVAGQVIGRAVVHIPKVGAVLTTPLLTGPLALIALGGTAALVVRLRRKHAISRPATGPATARRRHRHRRTGISLLDVMVLLDVLLIIGVAVSFLDSPAAAPPAAPRATQTGVITYQADAPVSDTYPSGRVATGDPVFLKLIHTIDVSFYYDTTAPPATVKGSARIDAVISTSDGWHTSLSITPPTPLVNGGTELTGVVDIERIQALASRVAEATGISSADLRIDVTATADVTMQGSTALPYTTQLPLQATPLELNLSGPQAAPGPHGPAITRTVALTAVRIPTPASKAPRQIQLAMLAALLLCLGATVIAWPTRPPTPVGIEASRPGTGRNIAAVEPAGEGG